MPAEDRFASSAEVESRALIQQMSQSLGLLRVAFDSTGEAMLIVDEGSVVRWANQQAADLWGGGITLQMVGRTLSALVQFHHLDQSPISDEEPTHPLQQALSSEGRHLYLLKTRSSSDLQPLPLISRLVSWRQIIQTDQRFVLLIIRDLDPLEKALARQRQFIDRLAHELRTPLAIITGNLHRMRRKEELSETIQQSLADASEETARISSLVDNLLLLSELDTDTRRWNLEIDDLCDSVHKWIAKLSPDLRGCLKVVVAEDVDDCHVRLDQDAFHLILNRLIENSCRFGRSNLSIEIQLTQTVSCVELRFSDNGPGLADDLQCLAVFERFVRIEDHRNPNIADGGGLGLSIVKSLMDGMGGEVSCCSPQSTSGFGRQGLVVILRFPGLRRSL